MSASDYNIFCSYMTAGFNKHHAPGTMFISFDRLGRTSQVGVGSGGHSVGMIKAFTSDFHIPFSHRQTCQPCPFLNIRVSR